MLMWCCYVMCRFGEVWTSDPLQVSAMYTYPYHCCLYRLMKKFRDSYLLSYLFVWCPTMPEGNKRLMRSPLNTGHIIHLLSWKLIASVDGKVWRKDFSEAIRPSNKNTSDGALWEPPCLFALEAYFQYNLTIFASLRNILPAASPCLHRVASWWRWCSPWGRRSTRRCRFHPGSRWAAGPPGQTCPGSSPCLD